MNVHTGVHILRYEWSRAKAAANRLEHRVDLADAVTVLEDPLALTIVDASGSEERFVTLGTAADGRLLVVVYACPTDDRIRLISTRDATRRERLQYEEDEP